MKTGIILLAITLTLFMNSGKASEPKQINDLIKNPMTESQPQFSNTGSRSGKIFTIQANTPWQKTGIKLHKGQSVIVSYLQGNWRVNPMQNEYDANGCPGTSVDNDAYILRLVNEGALCGRIGQDGEPFFIGNTREIIAIADGELFLCANDDINQSLGKGFNDNEGALDIVVYSIAGTVNNTDMYDDDPVPEDPDQDIPMELMGDYNPITGFTPQEACRLLVKSTCPAEQQKHLNTGRYRYIIWQQPTRYHETEYYSIKLTEKSDGIERDLEYFLVGANGEIFMRDEVNNEVATYDLVFTFPTIPLHIAENEMLSDPPEDELSFSEAAKLLALKLYLNNSLDISDITRLSLYYQGIMDYQGDEYYLLGICNDYAPDNPGILNKYCMDGKGEILKGIDLNEHMIWEPLIIN